MIHINIGPTRKSKVWTPSTIINSSPNGMIPHEEYTARNVYIADQLKNIDFKEADYVRPVDDATFNTEGAYKVTRIIRNWQEYRNCEPQIHKEIDIKWEPSKGIYLVYATKLKNHNPIMATADYFRKATENEKDSRGL